MTTDGVLLPHGIARTARAMGAMARALEADGYRTLALDYPSRTMDLARLADHVEAAAAPWSVDIEGRIHLVGYSLGALLVRVLLARHERRRRETTVLPPLPCLGRAVLLAPPNQGSEIADLLAGTRAYRSFYGPAGAQLGTRRDAETAALFEPGPTGVDVGVIAGTRSLDPLGWLILPKPNDGKVTLASTRLTDATDHLVLPATHTFIEGNARAIRATRAFLRHGRFASEMLG